MPPALLCVVESRHDDEAAELCSVRISIVKDGKHTLYKCSTKHFSAYQLISELEVFEVSKQTGFCRI